MTAGTLWLVPNTLGAPEPALDGEARAAWLASLLPAGVMETAGRLDYFIGEHAKSTRAFLKLVGTQRPVQEIEIAELNINTRAEALPALLAPLLAGRDAGLVSEAGVPAVADPGAMLVRLAHAKGVPVRPLVGPSSILMGVMASGLNGQSFAFNGYLSTDPAARAQRLRELEARSRAEGQTQVFIETPYRNQALLDALIATLVPSTLLCLATHLALPDEAVEMRPVKAWKGAKPAFHKKPTVFLFLAQ
ncbi:SAM-dependent methyltransferase [Derxia gummosa]|uniref:SAM-dependent methyltransferase n=1 Tax=Derxia gummosa DSM 723 TaxID=1121388 RepID=A0A8B6X6Z5_9BURK|nr:SAM-dependent methyltransferase [Derxia gummosa]